MKSTLIALIVLVIFMFLVYSRDLSTNSNATVPEQPKKGRYLSTVPFSQIGIVEIINGNDFGKFITCVQVKLSDKFISTPKIKLTSMNGPVNNLRIYPDNITKDKFNLCVKGNTADLNGNIKKLSVEYVASGMVRK
jgi:hypothetical protein